MKRFIQSAVLVAATALAWSGASAHTVLDKSEAPANSYQRLSFMVPHGCEGSPTLNVRIQIPDGVVGVKPQPKPGWELTIVRGTLKTPYVDHGKTITEGVTEVKWTGKLLDAHMDDFAMNAKLPDKAGETLYFATVQECEKGVHRWIEIPAAGKSRNDLKQPAPALKLSPKKAAH